MTIDQLAEINGLLTRFLRLSQDSKTPIKTLEAFSNRLEELGLTIDWIAPEKDPTPAVL